MVFVGLLWFSLVFFGCIEILVFPCLGVDLAWISVFFSYLFDKMVRKTQNVSIADSDAEHSVSSLRVRNKGAET